MQAASQGLSKLKHKIKIKDVKPHLTQRKIVVFQTTRFENLTTTSKT